ncbi:MAG: carbohydrate ABC transporter permease [Lachnospiraceae bacterium]|nr:carbohydrate ABC transporter permease [Lachnospiraceae bacterium]
MKKMVNLMKNILLWTVCLIMITPVLCLFSGAFMDQLELTELLGPVLNHTEGLAAWHFLPQFPTLQNLVELLLDSLEFYQTFWNSLKITLFTLVGQLIFAMPAAWGLAVYEFPGRKQLYFLYVILMMLPFQVTMLSEYLALDRLQLLDSHWAIIMPGVFSTFSVFLMYRFFWGVPKEVIEAARIDGAGEFIIFFHIGIPLGKAGIISAMVLQFLESFHQMERPLVFLKNKELWPLSMYLPEIDISQAGFAFCASLFALLPAVLVFLFGQEYLEQGIACTVQKE